MNVKWIEVPDEEVWEDGEIDEDAVAHKLYHRICEIGDWVVVERAKG